MLKSVSERLWESVDMSGGPDACWPWTRGKRGRGPVRYGTMYANRKNRLTHVLALEVTTGEAANGRCALHHCDNPPCCNPKHLYWGSRLDNTRDRDQRGRHVSLKGERHGCAILTEAQVREIKRRHIPRHPIHGGSALGREFGVNTSTINKVVLGKHWTHI